jgi:hypothetical protein
MDQTAVGFQISLFGVYSDLRPTHNTILHFMNAFADKNLVPNQYEEVELPDPQTVGKGTLFRVATPRFNFTSEDGTWQIGFGANRIDLQKNNPSFQADGLGEIGDFLQECENILHIIQERLYPDHYRW